MPHINTRFAEETGVKPLLDSLYYEQGLQIVYGDIEPNLKGREPEGIINGKLVWGDWSRKAALEGSSRASFESLVNGENTNKPQYGEEESNKRFLELEEKKKDKEVENKTEKAVERDPVKRLGLEIGQKLERKFAEELQKTEEARKNPAQEQGAWVKLVMQQHNIHKRKQEASSWVDALDLATGSGELGAGMDVKIGASKGAISIGGR